MAALLTPAYDRLVGVGGIGTGLVFAMEGDATLGRNESRPAKLLDCRDYCKLHIISHYVAVLLGKFFRVAPIGKVGNDERGPQLIDEMKTAGIDTTYVDLVADAPTLLSICFQYPDGSGGNVTTDNSAASALTPKDVDRALHLLNERAIALAVPEAPLNARNHLLRKAGEFGAFRVASLASAEVAAARELGIFSHVDLLALNAEEAETLAGEAFDSGKPLPFLKALPHRINAQLLISAGGHGAFAFSNGVWDHRAALHVPVSATAGAGDALLAGVLSGLAAGLPFNRPGSHPDNLCTRPIESALDLGVLLATYSVTSPHTIHPEANLANLLDFAARWNIETANLAQSLRSNC